MTQTYNGYCMKCKDVDAEPPRVPAGRAFRADRMIGFLTDTITAATTAARTRAVPGRG